MHLFVAPDPSTESCDPGITANFIISVSGCSMWFANAGYSKNEEAVCSLYEFWSTVQFFLQIYKMQNRNFYNYFKFLAFKIFLLIQLNITVNNVLRNIEAMLIYLL